MPGLKISDYVDVDSMDGTELVLLSKNGAYRKTTIEEIRNLANDITNTALADLVGKGASAQDVKNILTSINADLSEKANINDSPSITYFQAHKNYRAWQGVVTDGNYIFVATDRDENFNLQNIISVYDMSGNFIKEKLSAYTGTDSQGKFMSFGGLSIIDGILFATVYNCNSGGNPYISRVVEFSLGTLDIIKVTDIGGGIAESIKKYNGSYWVCYNDAQQIKQFDLSFNLLKTYSLSQPIGVNGGYQGLLWYNGDIYLNMHSANVYGQTSTGALDRYSFNGTTFNYIETIQPPTFGTTQDINYYNNTFYWNDRPSNRIVMTKSIKCGKIAPILNKVTNNEMFKPTLLNGWIQYDAVNDRTLKVWKDQMGIVHLQGIISSGTIGGTICILPDGYIPEHNMNFIAVSNATFARIAIQGKSAGSAAGNVICSLGDNTWLSLDGITFLPYPTI